jgi:tetratricopeptide (TPR) repeat protein
LAVCFLPVYTGFVQTAILNSGLRLRNTASISLPISLALAAVALRVSAIAFAYQHPSAGQQRETSEWVYVNQGPAKSTEIGDFYFKRKNYKAAVSRFQEAADTDPNYAPAYLGLGRAYEKLGLRPKALESYRKYLDLLPSDKDADNAKAVQRAIQRLSGASTAR